MNVLAGTWKQIRRRRFRPRNDLLRVRWDAKPNSFTRLWTGSRRRTSNGRMRWVAAIGRTEVSLEGQWDTLIQCKALLWTFDINLDKQKNWAKTCWLLSGWRRDACVWKRSTWRMCSTSTVPNTHVHIHTHVYTLWINTINIQNSNRPKTCA